MCIHQNERKSRGRTHNPLDPGSNPGRPIAYTSGRVALGRARRALGDNKVTTDDTFSFAAPPSAASFLFFTTVRIDTEEPGPDGTEQYRATGFFFTVEVSSDTDGSMGTSTYVVTNAMADRHERRELRRLGLVRPEVEPEHLAREGGGVGAQVHHVSSPREIRGGRCLLAVELARGCSMREGRVSTNPREEAPCAHASRSPTSSR
jgi:hypothetical protein